MTTQNTFQARVQLQLFHRLPVEIIHGDAIKGEPIQLPTNFINSHQPISATKQAFLDMASAPLLNLDDLDESFTFGDSDPEILLSDSDEEDDELIAMGDCDEQDADTAIDSDDLNNLSDSMDEGIDNMDVFEESEPTTTSSPTHNHSFERFSFQSTSTERAADFRPRRIFIDLPESQ